MNDKVNSYCTEIACDSPQFIVQLMGKDHPKQQKVFVMDEQGNKYYPDVEQLLTEQDIVSSLTKLNASFESKPFTISGGKLLSTLHTWSWEKLKNKNGLKTYLEISTTKAAPIVLPLDMIVAETPKKDDKQIHQIVPIIPCTQLYNVDNSTTIPCTELYNVDNSRIRDSSVGVPVLAREGYFYISISGKPWREIKIEQEEGTLSPIYRDIPLLDEKYYDNEELIFKTGEREATGEPLKEIWIPSSRNDNDISGEVSFFYSEIQLSAARLNFLMAFKERESEHRSTRVSLVQQWHTVARYSLKGNKYLEALELTYIKPSTRPSHYDKRILVKNHTNYSKAKETNKTIRATVFPATELAPQRGRDHLLEHLLDFPSKYIYDEKNTYLTDAITFAKEFLNQAKQGNELSNAKTLEQGALHHVLEEPTKAPAMVGLNIPAAATKSSTKADELNPPDLLSHFVKSITNTVDKVKTESPAVFEDKIQQSIWNAPTTQPFVNALQDAQARKIYCVCVEDIHYRTRHSVHTAVRAQEVMGKLSANIAKRKYFESALLIQQIVSPLKIGDKGNDHRKALRQMDNEGVKKLAYHSGVLERSVIAARYDEVTNYLLTSFQSPYHLSVWADHLSQDTKEHYAAAYSFLATALGILGTPTPEIDPYMSPDNKIHFDNNIAMSTKNSKANFEFVRALIHTPEQTLHKMLFAPLDEKNLADTIEHIEIVPNFGLGWARSDLLAECMKSGSIPEDKQTTIDAATVALIYGNKASQVKTSARDTTELMLRGLVGAVVNAVNTLDGLFSKAFNNLGDLNKKLNDITPDFNMAFRNYSVAQQSYNQLASEAQQQQHSVINQRADIQQRQQQTSTTREKLDSPVNQRQQEIGELNRQIYRQEIDIYVQKKWLQVQNITDLIGEAKLNTKNNNQAFVGRIRLYDNQGNMPVWRALLFDHQRNILGGMLKDAYIAPFKRYVDNTMVNGVLIRMPLKGLHFDDLKKLGGIVPDKQGDVTAGTTRSSVGGVAANIMPEYEGVIFARKGTQLERLISDLNQGDTSTPLTSSLTHEERIQVINQEQLRLERARQQNTADQQQIRSAQTDYGKALAEEKRISKELASEIKKGNKTEVNRLSQELKQAEKNRIYHQHLVNNPEARLHASKLHLNVLNAEKALAETKRLILEREQQGDRLALRDAESDIHVKRGQLNTAQAELTTAINAKKAAGKLLEQEQAIYNRYLNDMNIVNQDIVREQQNLRQVRENKLHSIANTGYFKIAIIGFQVYNFARACEVYNIDGSGRAKSGIAASVIDLAFAVEDYVAFLTKQNINETGLRKAFWRIDTNKLPRAFTGKSAFAINSAITKLAVAQSILGAVALGNNLYDVMSTANNREDGIVRFARWMLVVSSALAIIAPYFAGATFLLLTPMMLAAVIIGLIAAGLIYLFQDTQLESWIKNGPFSANGTSMAHLLDPTEAYYRLVGLFAGININIGRTNRVVRRASYGIGIYGSADDIRVDSHLVSLLGGTIDYKVECCYVSRFFGDKDPSRETIVETYDTQYGRRFITRPREVTNSSLGSAISSKLRVKAQLAITYQGKRFYFPTPKIENAKVRYTDGSSYNSPDFDDSKQPFWEEKERS